MKRKEILYEELVKCGAPWENMIAYVGPTINSENKKIVDLLHAL